MSCSKRCARDSAPDLAGVPLTVCGPRAYDFSAIRRSKESDVATRDPRIDAYIAKSADFAKPILEHVRALVHKTCPDAEETMKWSMPTFMHHGMLCGMGAFKQHCAVGFWKHKLVVGDDGDEAAMGQFGRVTSVKDLPPPRILAGYIKKAMQLNEEGVSIPRARAKPRPAPSAPDDLAGALKKNKTARAVFEAFSPSAKREYVEWITEAKREDTRAKRVATAVEWMAEGKQRNWKYMNC
jgi:uncharacterized protein YdeI (YjbR/CyaY-like superfamily)